MSPKYPKTFHLPNSPGATNDDRIASDISSLFNVPIIITEKCDGSNTSLESNDCFARTHSGPPTHASFDVLKSLHSNIKYKIPENVQFFGENLYAKHSIQYEELPGYFLLFNIRNLISNIWYSWDDIELWAKELEIPTVPVLFCGEIKTEKQLYEIIQILMAEPSKCGGVKEGVVVRIKDSFPDNKFTSSNLKFVRKNHVNTDSHWMHNGIIKNKLK